MDKKGFTLLELITVVIIVAILAAIATPQFFRVAERARCTEGVTTLGALRSSQLRYYTEHTPNFAADADDLDVSIGTLKHFGSPTVANDSTALATVTRTGSLYTLSIDEDGDMTCTDGGSDAYCSKMGF